MRHNLRKARYDMKMTVEEFSEMVHITPRYYQKIESGERMGGIDLWDKLEDLTGIGQRILRVNE